MVKLEIKTPTPVDNREVILTMSYRKAQELLKTLERGCGSHDVYRELQRNIKGV